jgi:hypothetical protein
MEKQDTNALMTRSEKQKKIMELRKKLKGSLSFKERKWAEEDLKKLTSAKIKESITKQDLIKLIKECHKEILKEGSKATFEQFKILVDDYGMSVDQLLNMMHDFFNSDQVDSFYKHCAEEMGLDEMEDDNEY